MLCRACLRSGYVGGAEPPDSCPHCGSADVRSSRELFDLAIAHIDCDAFYASVEKRDNPEIRD
ncbi:MAG: DNA polymerase IV, partial [Pseudomonadota bacterium]|nr:DNA polymerase IV [Pseudomonadota bacterium]